MGMPSDFTASYNGFAFSDRAQTTKYSIHPVPDKSGRTVAYYEFQVGITDWIIDTAGTSNAVSDAIDKLLKYGGEFHYTGRGLGNLDINVGGPGSGGKSDVQWGPKPGSLDLKVSGINSAIKIDWQVVVCIPYCFDASYAFALMEVTYSVTFRQRRSGRTDRIVSGELKIPNNRLYPGSRELNDSPDYYLEQIITPIPFGFRREWSDRTIDPSRTSLTWGYTDIEFDGEAYPFGCVSAKFSQETSSMGPGLFSYSTMFVGEYELAPGYEIEVAKKAFFDVVDDRLQQAIAPTEEARPPENNGQGGLAIGGAAIGGIAAGAGGGGGLAGGAGVIGGFIGGLFGSPPPPPPPAAPRLPAAGQPQRGFLPMEFRFSEADLYGPNICRFQFVAKIFQSDLSSIIGDSGIWRTDPGADWTRWATSLADSALNPRGVAQLTFSTNEDRIVDLCGTGQPDEMAPAKTSIQRVLSGFVPESSPGWVHYEIGVRVEGDSGAVEIRRLPEDDISPDDSTATATLGGGQTVDPGFTASLTSGGGGSSFGTTLGGGQTAAPGFGGSDDELPIGDPTASDGFNAITGDDTPYVKDGPTPVQQRTRGSCYIFMFGEAIRVGKKIPCPTLEKVESQTPILCNRLDMGEGFVTAIIRGCGDNTVYGATWNLRYFLKETPQFLIEPPPNPMLNPSGG